VVCRKFRTTTFFVAAVEVKAVAINPTLSDVFVWGSNCTPVGFTMSKSTTKLSNE